MDAMDRLRRAIGARAHEKFFADGYGWIGRDDVAATREEARASERELQLVLREFCESWLLDDQYHGSYVARPQVALWYETVDRAAFHRRNELRRKMLATLLEADEGGFAGFDFNADEEGWTQHSQGELVATGRTLDALGLADIRGHTSGYIMLRISAEGVRVATDPNLLARTLPISATEDDEGAAQIVSDALRPLIFDVEQLLEERGWSEARAELKEGDNAFADERWRDAVREYYRAVESGLKYRLNEARVGYGDASALRRLASAAAEHDLIPRNYQALFGFLDSIRSPKAHGSGPKPRDVPIGRNEALLLGNHARALLLYLGGSAS
jgi:hypothetical protein